MIEPINIRVYNASWGIDNSLFPIISIYDNTDDSIDFTGIMSWNTTTQHYQFFPDLNISKTYTANIDFWVTALTRYVSFDLSNTISYLQIDNTVKKWDIILHLGKKISTVI